MKNKNAILMTVKGQVSLTECCLLTMFQTDPEEINYLVLVDAAENDRDAVQSDLLNNYSIRTSLDGVHFDIYTKIIYKRIPLIGISAGWNEAVSLLIERLINEFAGDFGLEQSSRFRKDVNVWFLNNDVKFLKPGWLETLAERLEVDGTGLVGSSAMSVFGHPFATGGIWGTTLEIALQVAENGKVLDERLNFAYQDVDLSVRIAKAGYVVTHAPNVELGDDPMMKHLVSKTVYSNEGESNVMMTRDIEAEIFIQKHGRRE